MDELSAPPITPIDKELAISFLVTLLLLLLLD